VKIGERLDLNLLQKINLSEYDYVVDAIDDISNKMNLIKYCKDNGINIISSMGAGNKICLPNYIVSDIYDTAYDKLAKIIRTKCREIGIKNLDVVYMKTDKVIASKGDNIGSISYHPCVCGAVLAGFVVNKLINLQH
ncbi:MAG: tRNA threonylcarbamoyladenosine dehydratase, partial [Christensenellales bacterium]